MPVPDEVRTILCCASSGIALIAARKHREGRARLKCQDSRELPSACDRVQRFVLNVAERQIVNVAEDISMRDVEVGNRTLRTKISSVLREGPARVTGSRDPDTVVDRFGPGIRTDEAEALAHAPFCTRRKTVEVRVAD